MRYGTVHSSGGKAVGRGLSLRLARPAGGTDLLRPDRPLPGRRRFSWLSSVCARCNEPFEEPFAFSFEDRFVKAVFHKEEDETYPFEGETIDLTQAFLDELFLQLPMVSLCKPDCKGLCPVCGIDLNRFRCNCAEKTRNSAFDALKALSFEDKEV